MAKPGDGGVYAELVQNRAFQGNDVSLFLGGNNIEYIMQTACERLSPLEVKILTVSQIYPSTFNNWTAVGSALLSLDKKTEHLSSALPLSLRVHTDDKHGTIGMSNAGYGGFPVVSSWEYQGSFWIKGAFHGDIKICLESLQKKTFAQAVVKVKSALESWTEYSK